MRISDWSSDVCSSDLDIRSEQAPWQIELASAEPRQSRAQIKADQLGQRHGKMGMTMCVDRKPRELDLLVAQCAFNRRTRLPPIENDRHIIHDSPLVEDMCVCANGRGAAAGFVAGEYRVQPFVKQHFQRSEE